MTALSKTTIEYSSGCHWQLVTGCDHGLAECATADKCWARQTYATRLKHLGRSFVPTLHPELLDVRLPRKPSRILVSFMGDMFSDWWLVDERVRSWTETVNYALKGRIALVPEHSFLFLTKAPQNLALFNPWPDNAWIGVSITGAEPPERQAEMLAALERVEGGHIWLSYEPALGQLEAAPARVEWLTVGVQSGAGRLRPKVTWIKDAIYDAQMWMRPVWVKENARKLYPDLPALEQLPEGMIR